MFFRSASFLNLDGLGNDFLFKVEDVSERASEPTISFKKDITGSF